MISKDEAIYNISKAYLDYCVANRLYWDSTAIRAADREYFTAQTLYQTMRECYHECDILTWQEIDEVTVKKYKLERIKPTE